MHVSQSVVHYRTSIYVKQMIIIFFISCSLEYDKIKFWELKIEFLNLSNIKTIFQYLPFFAFG